MRLRTRFIKTHSLDDYEEAMALLEKILDQTQTGGCPDSICGEASLQATCFAILRYLLFTNPENSEVAISRLRATLSSSSVDETIRFHFTEMLSMLVRGRFRDYRLSESLEEANSNISQLVGLSSSQSLEKPELFTSEIEDVRETFSTTVVQQKIQNLEELLSSTPLGTENHKRCLDSLADWYKTKFCHTKDTSDIRESIEYSRLSLDATHARDPWRINRLTSLHNILFIAFEETREVNYLNESIAVGYDILKLKTAWQN